MQLKAELFMKILNWLKSIELLSFYLLGRTIPKSKVKKILEKDKKLRSKINNKENRYFILKSIFRNSNFFSLVRWNAFIRLKNLSKNNSKISVSSRCLYSINRKRFNKLTTFSRHIFLKLIQSGKINGMRKSSW